MNKLTKRKWMAKLGFTKVICPKCGNNLKAVGYYKVECSCGFSDYDSYGNFWSQDWRTRKDPYIVRETGEFKE